MSTLLFIPQSLVLTELRGAAWTLAESRRQGFTFRLWPCKRCDYQAHDINKGHHRCSSADAAEVGDQPPCSGQFAWMTVYLPELFPTRVRGTAMSLGFDGSRSISALGPLLAEKSAVTPGPLAPARELLGEMLLEVNEPAQALEQFEAALKKEPGRFRTLYGAARAAKLSGNRDASQKYFRDLLNICFHADSGGRSELTEAAAETALKPILENDRVAVWDLTDSAPARAFDAVIVSFSGSVAFLPKGVPTKIAERAIVIDLKEHADGPIANTSGYPLAFPRPGVTKILENEPVIVWDATWAHGVATPMHFHDKDVVAVFLEAGDLKSTGPDGSSVVNPHTPGEVRFTRRNRAHAEMCVHGNPHAIFTELK